jgi:type IV secretion system protein VirB10
MAEPKQQATPEGETDIRPNVAMPSRGLPVWIMAVVALAAAAILFVILDARRRALTAPAVQPVVADASAFNPPPGLRIPPEIVPYAPPSAPAPQAPPPAPPPQPTPAQAPAEPQIIYLPQSPPQIAPTAQPRSDTSPALVIDTGVSMRAESGAAGAASTAAEGARNTPPALDTDRARAGVFANRPTTVPQGTLIAAVLESALDTTRPGFARAVVSRDVRSFDGSRILIPRGSRLIGEVGSDTRPGQNRALINWTRLIRPDGATIAIGSPAADTLGGTGVRARVNSHFWERFSGAILQSALDVGVNIAAREAGGGTVIALPGSFGGATTQMAQPQQIPPTLSVKRGTSISVFVARDLDFTGVEARR